MLAAAPYGALVHLLNREAAPMTGVAAPTESSSAQIAAEIRRRIRSGELAAGDRVPSTRQLTRDFGVAMATATKALAVLRRDGLVRALPGIGTVVAADPAPNGAAVHPPDPTDSDTATLDRERGLTGERVVLAAVHSADAE